MEKIKSKDVFVKILSFLPLKDAVRTSVLSKQWEFLWLCVPKLEYDDSNMSEIQSLGMLRWADRNLPLYKAQVLDSMRLNTITRSFKPEDVEFWVRSAAFRSVRDLSVRYIRLKNEPHALLPSDLYECRSLVTLQLEGNILVDLDCTVCLPSLKTLIVRRVTYAHGSCLQKLLFCCPFLEELLVERCDGYHGKPLEVIAAFLRRLTIEVTIGCHYNGFEIIAPSLNYFKFTDRSYYGDDDYDGDEHCYYGCYGIQNMPKLDEACIDSEFYYDTHNFVEDIIRPLKSVKRLSLCLLLHNQEALYGKDIVFHNLEHLKLCSCQPDWTTLLFRLLKDSPNLRDLEVYHNDDHCYSYEDMNPLVCSNNRLSDVPECLLWSLQTLRWTKFYRSEKRMDLVKYILKYAFCLKNATILAHSPYDPKKKLEMIEELSLSPRASASCQLSFFERS